MNEETASSSERAMIDAKKPEAVRGSEHQNEPVFSLSNVVTIEKIIKKEPSNKNEVNEQSVVVEPFLHEVLTVCDPIRFEIPLEFEKLSFCKNSVMWEIVQYWETFRKMPQNLHFCPLEKSNAKAREGDALGHMVTFSNLAKTACKFQLVDPISDFEETLKALAKLKSHGFDIQKIQDQLQLLIKNRRVDTSIREMQESNAKLIEKHESIITNMQKDGSKAMKLQKEVDELEESIQDLEYYFYKAVSSSW
ncbi:hypothetical protein GIB67_039271 [Kingdonia uniflora]|uniref:Uncharacterized protein n=1 Tax=Kingdonia uniflora TaxID=39325 RepID=A0A7J7MMB2_9MAGN|nr:hypothetical protein GIB67_039271 [Kingdonia uniflora]